MMTALAGLATVLTAVTLVWLLSLRRRDASIADVAWGLGFVLLAWLYCALSPTLTPRSWLVAALITLWGTRLSWHIFRRNHGKGEDSALPGDARLAWAGVLVAEPLHRLLAARRDSVVRRPAVAGGGARRVQPAGLTAIDVLGVVLFAVGFGFEVVGDYQLERFRADPANRGQRARPWTVALHAASQLLRRRHSMVGPVCHRERQRLADGSPR